MDPIHVQIWFGALNFSSEAVLSLLPVKAHETVFQITLKRKTVLKSP